IQLPDVEPAFRQPVRAVAASRRLSAVAEYPGRQTEPPRFSANGWTLAIPVSDSVILQTGYKRSTLMNRRWRTAVRARSRKSNFLEKEFSFFFAFRKS